MTYSTYLYYRSPQTQILILLEYRHIGSTALGANKYCTHCVTQWHRIGSISQLMSNYIVSINVYYYIVYIAAKVHCSHQDPFKLQSLSVLKA